MAAKTISIHGTSVSIPTGLFINNEFVEAINKKTFSVENPATAE
jgi:aldehyde dehydrogenase (NAD+)